VTAAVQARHVTVAPDSERSKFAPDLVIAGDLGFVSGVRPVDLANDRVPLPEKVEAQTRKIFSNLDVILDAAGLERKNLAFVRIHLVDFERLIERVNKTYVECIGEGPRPARTAVGVSHITRGALIEMDFVVRT
jgi:2-iminobutanoate/2-iminopropanoate deaminase